MRLRLYGETNANDINHSVGDLILTNGRGRPIVSPPKPPANRAETTYFSEGDTIADGKIILRGTGFQLLNGAYVGTVTSITVVDLTGKRIIYELSGLELPLNDYLAAGAEANAENAAISTLLDRLGDITVVNMPFNGSNRAADDYTGNDGDNLINGRGGNDILRGGLGNDTIDGGQGNDTINGGDGNDRLLGDRGNDLVTGGAGNDQIFGADGNDTLDGEGGNNRIDGGSGDDSLRAGDGDDTIDGGRGNDRATASGGNDQLTGGLGNDTLSGGDGNDSLNGGRDSDRMEGGAGADTLDGERGNDQYFAGANDGAADVLIFGSRSGADTVSQFGEEDTIRFVGSAQAFTALTITQSGEDALIAFRGGSIRLLSTDAETLDATDFLFS